MQVRIKITLLIVMTSAMFVLAGCKPEPKANEAELVVADVQGVSFSDPLPATSESGEAPAVEAVEPTATVSPAAVAEDDAAMTTHATAASMPLDIAAIPSATPMPSPTPDPVVEQPAADVAVASGDYVPLSFKKLSGYKYVEPIPGQEQDGTSKPEISDQIPAEIKALSGTKAIVEGWMVPMDVAEDGSVKSFVLVKTQPQCCFGDMQAMNEWVDVVMQPGKSAEFNVDLPMKVYGEFEVGEKTEDGFVLSVYRMTADRVEL